MNNNEERTTPARFNMNNNSNGARAGENNPVAQLQNRLFYTLFYRVTLTYARAFPQTVRRAVEFVLFLKALFALGILIYVHAVFSSSSMNCLDHIQNVWPREGILRVEVLQKLEVNYTLFDSYRKEYSDAFLYFQSSLAGELDDNEELEKEQNDDADVIYNNETSIIDTGAGMYLKNSSEVFTIFSSTFNEKGDSVDETKSKHQQGNIVEDNVDERKERSFRGQEDLIISKMMEGDDAENQNSFSVLGEENTGTPWSFIYSFLSLLFADSGTEEEDTIEDVTVYRSDGRRLHQNMSGSASTNFTAKLAQSLSELEMLKNAVFPEEKYIMEYAAEYGLLRLLPKTRKKLNIPVMFVILDAEKEACFRDGFSRFLLDEFLGYDDILMSSIKRLVEKDDHRGYLRNVVTGENFRFMSTWMARSSYLAAAFVMLVFTVSVSTLLRYSHNQIFIFILNLLQMFHTNMAIVFPAAPLLTVILALVGMEAVMSEFFNDATTAFYIILIVWIADQYDSICCCTNISKRMWLRFFYLYHFAFYAYYYRFNGQYCSLALFTSWLFIQHSMIYFFHHYELPAVLQQAHMQDIFAQPPTAEAASQTSPPADVSSAGTGTSVYDTSSVGRTTGTDGGTSVYDTASVGPATGTTRSSSVEQASIEGNSSVEQASIDGSSSVEPVPSDGSNSVAQASIDGRISTNNHIETESTTGASHFSDSGTFVKDTNSHSSNSEIRNGYTSTTNTNSGSRYFVGRRNTSTGNDDDDDSLKLERSPRNKSPVGNIDSLNASSHSEDKVSSVGEAVALENENSFYLYDVDSNDSFRSGDVRNSSFIVTHSRASRGDSSSTGTSTGGSDMLASSVIVGGNDKLASSVIVGGNDKLASVSAGGSDMLASSLSVGDSDMLASSVSVGTSSGNLS